MDSPSRNEIISNSFFSCCTLPFCTRSEPTRMDPNRLPRLLRCPLDSQTSNHFWWHRLQDGLQRHSIFVEVISAELDSIPNTPSLQLHLHEEAPFGVVRPCQ